MYIRTCYVLMHGCFSVSSAGLCYRLDVPKFSRVCATCVLNAINELCAWCAHAIDGLISFSILEYSAYVAGPAPGSGASERYLGLRIRI